MNIDYELPPVVEAIRKAWLSVGQISAIVASGFTIVSAQFLLFGKDISDNSTASALAIAISIFAYASVVFSASAALSSLILIGVLGNIPVLASKDPDLLERQPDMRGHAMPLRTSEATPLYILKRYGAGNMWVWIMWHWFISLHAGFGCLLVQVILCVFLRESTYAKIILLCIVAFSVLPLALFSMFDGSRPTSKS